MAFAGLGPPGGGMFERGRGPAVLPGTYHLAVTVRGTTEEGSVTVNFDPTLKVDPAELRTQLQAGLEARNALSALNDMLNRVDAMQKALADFQRTIGGSSDDDLKKKYAPLLRRARELGTKLKTMKDDVYNSDVQQGVGEDSIHYLERFHDRFQGLSGAISSSFGEAPNALVREQTQTLMTELHRHLDDFNKLIKTDVAAYNKEAFNASAPTLYAGEPIAIKKVTGF